MGEGEEPGVSTAVAFGRKAETVVTMPKMDREAREARAAEVAQAKVQKQRQLDKAMTQERERQHAVLDRTEKLKAQRLARSRARPTAHSDVFQPAISA